MLRACVATGIATAYSVQSDYSAQASHHEPRSGGRGGFLVEHGPSPGFDPEAHDEESRLRDRCVDVDSGAGLSPVLAATRADWPEFREITARMPYQPGVLLVGLEPPLAKLVLLRLAEEGASGRFLKGLRVFDKTNRYLGLRGVRSFRSLPGTFTFWFDPCVDEPRAAKRYRSLRWVRYAEPNRLLGDGSDLHAFWDGGRSCNQIARPHVSLCLDTDRASIHVDVRQSGDCQEIFDEFLRIPDHSNSHPFCTSFTYP